MNIVCNHHGEDFFSHFLFIAIYNQSTIYIFVFAILSYGEELIMYEEEEEKKT